MEEGNPHVLKFLVAWGKFMLVFLGFLFFLRVLEPYVLVLIWFLRLPEASEVLCSCLNVLVSMSRLYCLALEIGGLLRECGANMKCPPSRAQWWVVVVPVLLKVVLLLLKQ